VDGKGYRGFAIIIGDLMKSEGIVRLGKDLPQPPAKCRACGVREVCGRRKG
jgi:hypothetical protein